MAEDTNETVEHEEQAAAEQAEPVAEEAAPDPVEEENRSFHDRIAALEEVVRKIKAKLHHM